MAVQIPAYEVRVAYLDRQQAGAPQLEETPYPLVDDLERFYQHWSRRCSAPALFARPIRPVMSRLRRLFTRARPEGQELNILRGMLTSIEKQDKHQGN